MINAGGGQDRVILRADSGNDVITLATNASDSIIINNFQVTNDKLALLTTTVSVNDTLIQEFDSNGTNQPVNGFTIFVDIQSAVFELELFLPADVNLDDATDGSQLYQGLRSGELALEFIRLDSDDAWRGYIVAYDNNDAYVYYADSDLDALGPLGISAEEISLVAILTDVSVGALTANNFQLV